MLLQIISYTSGEIGIGSSEFRKRVGFAVSMPSTNLSIYINNTQESDSGRYLCSVIIPGAPGLSGELQLSVIGEQSEYLDSVHKKRFDHLALIALVLAGSQFALKGQNDSVLRSSITALVWSIQFCFALFNFFLILQIKSSEIFKHPGQVSK